MPPTADQDHRSPQPRLSIVLPCRNQADHIGRVLGQYFAPLDRAGVAYELIVVPNACTDETCEIVEGLARNEPRMVVVQNPKGGWGLSVLTGLHAARGELLCYANSARTDPAQIPALLRLYEERAPCLAKATRVHRGAPLREWGSWLYNLESRLLFGLPTVDVNGTPKIFSREVFEIVAPSSEGDLLDLELVAGVCRLGLAVVEMPVAGFERHGGVSSTNLASAWNMYAGALALRFARGEPRTDPRPVPPGGLR